MLVTKSDSTTCSAVLSASLWPVAFQCVVCLVRLVRLVRLELALRTELREIEKFPLFDDVLHVHGRAGGNKATPVSWPRNAKLSYRRPRRPKAALEDGEGAAFLAQEPGVRKLGIASRLGRSGQAEAFKAPCLCGRERGRRRQKGGRKVGGKDENGASGKRVGRGGRQGRL